MSLQAKLNEQAIDMLPLTKDFLVKNKLDSFCLLRNINNSYKPLSEMTNEELKKFDAEQLALFKYKECQN